MKHNYFILIFLFAIAQNSIAQYSQKLNWALSQTKTNKQELLKAITYFNKKRDSIKIKSVIFLIENMPIHKSYNYYWADNNNSRIKFSELAFDSYSKVENALDSISKIHGNLHPVINIYRDIDSITSELLIENVENAVDTWRSGIHKNCSFENFCEYILPYRTSIEPLQNWRKLYRKKFEWVTDSLKTNSIEKVLELISNDLKRWVINTYDVSTRKEPLPRLGALQLLQRKKGP